MTGPVVRGTAPHHVALASIPEQGAIPIPPGGIPAGFRDAMANLTAGVCVITSLSPAGDPIGLTVSSGFSVSMLPPVFGLSLDLGSRTLPHLLEHGSYVANILHGDASPVALTFASRSEDKFAGLDWQHTASGLPWLPWHSVRGVECEVQSTVEAGDHIIVLGSVLDVHRPPSEPRQTLAYLDRQFHPVPRRAS